MLVAPLSTANLEVMHQGSRAAEHAPWMEGKFETHVLSKVATYERVASRFGLSLCVSCAVLSVIFIDVKCRRWRDAVGTNTRCGKQHQSLA